MLRSRTIATAEQPVSFVVANYVGRDTKSTRGLTTDGQPFRVAAEACRVLRCPPLSANLAGPSTRIPASPAFWKKFDAAANSTRIPDQPAQRSDPIVIVQPL